MDGEGRPWKQRRLERSFSRALTHQILKRGDTASSLSRLPDAPNATTLSLWMSGPYLPRKARSFEFLARLEQHYGLRQDYFADRVFHVRAVSAKARALVEDNPLPRLGLRADVLRWHLPDDFADRSDAERREIEIWLNRTLVNPECRYRRYLKDGLATQAGFDLARKTDLNGVSSHHDLLLRSGLPHTRRRRQPVIHNRPSPKPLIDAWNALVRFKTTPITPPGMQRDTVWAAVTVEMHATMLGNVFGVIAAPPHGRRRGGLGAPVPALTFALLLVPEVIDAFLAVKATDRGFLSRGEVALLEFLHSLAKPRTGWMRQSPWLASELRTVDGLVSSGAIALARTDWNGFCDHFGDYVATRARDVRRVRQSSRNVMAPIAVVLSSPAPLVTYRRIADEVLRRLPDRTEQPLAAAIAVQTFLMLRIGMHTGLRQKNLRQLMFQPKGAPPTPEAELARLRRGELRWDSKTARWRLLLPRTAFKNGGSSFFRHGPHDIALPDVASLYPYIDLHLAGSRALLVADRPEPDTFFVNPVRYGHAEYNNQSFYNAWRLAIQMYGVYNPWTGRGAIEGLLPHGPHCVRAVLATHVLKVTGSYEYAGYAIQDLPGTVEKSYARFLPSEKGDLVARVLAPVWEPEEADALRLLPGASGTDRLAP